MKSQITYALFQRFWGAVDWLYPPTCGGCGKLGLSWCSSCDQKTIKLKTSICPICGSLNTSGQLCSDCKINRPRLKAIRSWGLYQGSLREAIIRFKFQRDIGLSAIFSKFLLDLYFQQNWFIDLITVVPLSSKRLRKRGYNQAHLLAQPFSWATGIKYSSKAIHRVRDTLAQMGLSAQERKQNVRNVFSANADIVEGKSILLIDDITTTGATMLECTNSLLFAGAASVYGLTLARTPFKYTLENNLNSLEGES